ncbi:MAG TPA: dicarboxylate transporter/tellurite-resistance protein TehA [Devosiaceae bacterium]|jgi:tellurite resistance protein
MPKAFSALPRVPASFFSMVLGLAGLANDWRLAHAVWSLPAVIGEVLYAAAFLTWLLFAVLYALKWIAAPALAKEEASNAVQCCFIGLGGVATMLVAQGAIPYFRPLAIVVFVLGAAFTVVFALWRTGYLWRGNRDPASTTPVLYLPMVAGGFVTGNVAAALGWPQMAELAFGAAFFTWMVIESVLLHRLYTAAPLPPALRPTLGIQLAPPAVGAVCYLSVGGGHPDLFASMLVGYALLQALLLTRLARWIAEQPFAPSYWAFTFGATALAGATIRLSVEDQGGMYAALAPILFILANLLVLAIAAGTVRLVARGKLFPPAPPPAMA